MFLRNITFYAVYYPLLLLQYTIPECSENLSVNQGIISLIDSLLYCHNLSKGSRN